MDQIFATEMLVEYLERMKSYTKPLRTKYMTQLIEKHSGLFKFIM